VTVFKCRCRKVLFGHGVPFLYKISLYVWRFGCRRKWYIHDGNCLILLALTTGTETYYVREKENHFQATVRMTHTISRIRGMLLRLRILQSNLSIWNIPPLLYSETLIVSPQSHVKFVLAVSRHEYAISRQGAWGYVPIRVGFSTYCACTDCSKSTQSLFMNFSQYNQVTN
jgi:hypothetical protein